MKETGDNKEKDTPFHTAVIKGGRKLLSQLFDLFMLLLIGQKSLNHGPVTDVSLDSLSCYGNRNLI